jgi:hypothetical protein
MFWQCPLNILFVKVYTSRTIYLSFDLNNLVMIGNWGDVALAFRRVGDKETRETREMGQVCAGGRGE